MAQHYNPRISNVSDLIFYLDAVNLKSYPSSGAIWYDISGNNNHFTLFNSPTYTQNGTTGTYLTFNGTNQYARSTNAINFNNYPAVTIEIGYRTTVTNATQILYETTGTGGSTATGGITLLMNANNTSTVANTYLSTWQGYGPRLVGYTVSTNTTFNNIIETFVNGVDATGRQTYVNASPATYFTNTTVVSTATTTTSGLAFANTWTYIASRAGTSNFFNGDITYVKAYGVKISASNITTNLNSINLRQPSSYTSPTFITTDPTVQAPSLYSFTTFTLTTATAQTTGTGAILSQFLSAYDTVTYPWLTNTSYFNVTTPGFQKWTVPVTGNYTIRVAGAAGHAGRATAGTCQGIIIETSPIALTGGDIINIIVATRGNIYTSGGGGGGSFVWNQNGNTLIMAAGGGGGGNNSTVTAGTVANSNGQSGTSGGATTDSAAGTPGTNGSGGTGSVGGWGGGGAGWLSNGTDGNLAAGYAYQGRGYYWQDPATPAHGGNTNTTNGAYGGFGGGGGTHGNSGGGGGGGGYSGGAGGGQSTVGSAGGGGGSYSIGTITVIGYTTGHGYVTITKL